MNPFQWTGVAIFLLALSVYILTLVRASLKRFDADKIPFAALFACVFFALAGIYMAASVSTQSTLTLTLVNTVHAVSDSMVYLPQTGLIRGISKDPLVSNFDTLYLNFKTEPLIQLNTKAGISALAVTNGILYIGQLFGTALLSLNGTELKTIAQLPAPSPHLAVSKNALNVENSNDIFVTVGKRVYWNGIPLNGTVQPFALCVYGDNLYISDNARVLVMRQGKIIRDIGPLPPARRLQIWKNQFLVIVPIRFGSQTQIFDLNGVFLTTIDGPVNDLAVSDEFLFLTDGAVIRVFEQV
jgi:hypothetical protein